MTPAAARSIGSVNLRGQLARECRLVGQVCRSSSAPGAGRLSHSNGHTLSTLHAPVWHTHNQHRRHKLRAASSRARSRQHASDSQNRYSRNCSLCVGCAPAAGGFLALLKQPNCSSVPASRYESARVGERVDGSHRADGRLGRRRQLQQRALLRNGALSPPLCRCSMGSLSRSSTVRSGL